MITVYPNDPYYIPKQNPTDHFAYPQSTQFIPQFSNTQPLPPPSVIIHQQYPKTIQRPAVIDNFVKSKINIYKEEKQPEFEIPSTFKKSNIKALFEKQISIKSDYKIQKLINDKETREYLVQNFIDFESKLRTLEGDFTGLEKSFYHLIIKSEISKDYKNRLLGSIEKKIDEFMERFDRMGTNNFDASILQDEYEFQTFKNLLKHGVVEISNRLNEFFVQRNNNSQAYDFEIFKCLENILALNNFLKADFTSVVGKSYLNYGRILDHICNRGPSEQVNFAEFIRLDISQLQNQQCVIPYKKSIISEKFHSIVQEKINTCTKMDYNQLIKSVFVRERRKVFQNIYNYVNKQAKLIPDFDQSGQNKALTDKMNKIKQEFIQIKNSEFYLEILSGRLDSQVLQDCGKKVLFQIQKFMLKVNQLIKEIKKALKDIIDYKDQENQHAAEKYDNILKNKIISVDEEKPFAENSLGDYVLILFQKLEDALMKDPQQNHEDDLEEKMNKQFKKHKENLHVDKAASNLLVDIKIRSLVKKFIKKLKLNAKLVDNDVNKRLKDLQDEQKEVVDKLTVEEKQFTDYQQHPEKYKGQDMNKFIEKLHQLREKNYLLSEKIKKVYDIQEKVKELNVERQRQQVIVDDEQFKLNKLLQESSKNKSVMDKLKISKAESQQKGIIKKEQEKIQEIDKKIADLKKEANEKIVQRNSFAGGLIKGLKGKKEQEVEKKKTEEEQNYEAEQQRREYELKKRLQFEQMLREEEEEEQHGKHYKPGHQQNPNKQEEVKKGSQAGKLAEELKQRREMEDQLRKQQEEKKQSFTGKLTDGIKEKKKEEEKQYLETLKEKQREEEKRMKEEQERQKKLREDQEKSKQQKAIEEKKKKEEEYNKKLEEIKQREEKEKQERKLKQLKDEEERKKKQEEEKLQLQKKLQEEEKKKKEKQEEEARKKKQKEEEDQKRQKEEEEKRLLKKKQEEEEKKRKLAELEEERKRQEQVKKEQDELKKKQFQDEEKKKEEEKKRKQQEDEKKRKEDEEKKKKQQEEDKKREEEKKKEDEKKKKMLEEQKKKDEEDRKKKEEDEKRKKEEEKKKKDEEERKKKELEDKKKKEEEDKKKKLQEEQKKKEEEEKKRKEEDEKRRKDEEKRKKDEEERKKKELEDKKKKEEEEKRKKDEMQKKNKPNQFDDIEEIIDSQQSSPNKKQNDDLEDFSDIIGGIAGNQKKKEDPKIQPKKAYNVDNDLFDQKPQASKNKNLFDNNNSLDIEEDSDIIGFSKPKVNQKKNQEQKILGALTGVSKENPKQVESKNKHQDEEYDFDFEDEIDDLMPMDKAGGNKPNQQQNKQQQQQPQKKEDPKQKKQSQFTYDIDIDDEEDNYQDDFEPEESHPKGKGSQQTKSKQESSQMNSEQMKLQEEYNEQQRQQIEEQMKIMAELIQKTNEYVKKTRFGRQNQVNLSKFNQFDYVVGLYEEFIQLGTCFYFDIEQGDQLLQIFEAWMQEQDINKEANQYMQSIHQMYYEYTQQIQFNPQARLFFPFQENQFGFQLIEVNQEVQTISFFYIVDINEESMKLLQQFAVFFSQLFGFEEYSIQPYKLEDDTIKVLQVYQQEIYLQYILMLFPICYEDCNGQLDIVINQNTIDRIFYILLSQELLYPELDKNLPALEEKFGQIYQQYEDCADMSLFINTFEQFNDESVNEIYAQTKAFIQNMQKNKQKLNTLCAFEFVMGDIKYVYYVNISRNQQQGEIGIFCLTISDQMNEMIINLLSGLETEEFVVNPQIDSSRHNGLYLYTEFTLAIWAHLIQKKKYTAFEAINIINFSMIPYYTIFKNLE